MASRLFQSVVVSSALLLSSGATGCAASVVMSEDAAPDAPAGDAATGPDASAPDAVAPTVDAAPAVDAPPAVDASVADALQDARSLEGGWPTTKAFFCVTPESGAAEYCCYHAGSPPTHCCLPNPGRTECDPCTVNAAQTACISDSAGGS